MKYINPLKYQNFQQKIFSDRNKKNGIEFDPIIVCRSFNAYLFFFFSAITVITPTITPMILTSKHIS